MGARRRSAGGAGRRQERRPQRSRERARRSGAQPGLEPVVKVVTQCLAWGFVESQVGSALRGLRTGHRHGAPPGRDHRPSLVRSRPRQSCPVRPSADAAPPWCPVRRRSEEPPPSRRTAARALHRPAALAPYAADRRTRQGGGEVAGIRLRLHHPHRPPGRAAERLPLLHPHCRLRRHPSRPASESSGCTTPGTAPPLSSQRPESRPAS